MKKRKRNNNLITALIVGSLVLANRSNTYASNLPSVNTTREEQNDTQEEQNDTQIVNEPIECKIFYDDGSKEIVSGNPNKPNQIQQVINIAKEKGSRKITIIIPSVVIMDDSIDITGMDLTIIGDKNRPASIYMKNKNTSCDSPHFFTNYAKGKKSSLTLSDLSISMQNENRYICILGDFRGDLTVKMNNFNAESWDIYGCTEIIGNNINIKNQHIIDCKDVSYNSSTINNLLIAGTDTVTINQLNNVDFSLLNTATIYAERLKSTNLSLDAISDFIGVIYSNITNLNSDNVALSGIFNTSINSFDVTNSNIDFEYCYFSAKPANQSYMCGPNVKISFSGAKTKDNHTGVYNYKGACVILPIIMGGIETDSNGDMTKIRILPSHEEPKYTYISSEKNSNRAFRTGQRVNPSHYNMRSNYMFKPKEKEAVRKTGNTTTYDGHII